MSPEESYRRYFPMVRHHCQRLLGDGAAAQDVAQETFLRLLQTPVSGGEEGTMKWLYRTSSNLAVDALRKRRRTPVEALRPAPAPPDALAELRGALERLAQQVPREALQVALLRSANGLTQPELAQLLDVTDRTIRRWLTQVDEAMEALRAEVC